MNVCPESSFGKLLSKISVWTLVHLGRLLDKEQSIQIKVGGTARSGRETVSHGTLLPVLRAPSELPWAGSMGQCDSHRG